MKDDKYHYLTKKFGKSFPHRFLFIDTETFKPDDSFIQEHRMRLGISCYVKIGNSPKDIIQETWRFFTTQESLCNYIDSLIYDKNPLYVLASNPKFDLGAIALPKYFTEWGYKLQFIAESGMVFILTLKKDKQTLKFLAIQNFFTTSIKQIGKMIDKPKLDVDVFTDDMDLLSIYCFRDVEILMDGFLSYLNYVYDNDMGSFGLTKTAQSMNAYKYKFMDYFILIHKNKKASELERLSYHGGRVEAFHIGKQKKKDYYQLDINSMYPYVMKDNYYPYKLLGRLQKGNINQLRILLKTKCCIATVRLNTNETVYAKKMDNKCCFPLGTFVTTLTTPSLLYALEHEHIIELIDGYYYERGKLFTEYINYFWKERLKYQKQGDNIRETMVKIFLNSFYGKWGQMIPQEISSEYTDDNKFELIQEYYEKTGQYKTVRTLFHKKQVFMGKKESKDSFVGIASHVTDYARMYLWQLMNEVGINNIYYMDTDSLIIDKNSYNKVKDSWIGKELGKLKVEKVSNHLIIHTLKDYELGDKIRRKGINKKSVIDEMGKVKVLTGYSLSHMMRLQKDDCAILAYVIKTITRNYTKGIINEKGNVLPFVLNELD